MQLSVVYTGTVTANQPVFLPPTEPRLFTIRLLDLWCPFIAFRAGIYYKLEIVTHYDFKSVSYHGFIKVDSRKPRVEPFSLTHYLVVALVP